MPRERQCSPSEIFLGEYNLAGFAAEPGGGGRS
jgi:hypothetical protein